MVGCLGRRCATSAPGGKQTPVARPGEARARAVGRPGSGGAGTVDRRLLCTPSFRGGVTCTLTMSEFNDRGSGTKTTMGDKYDEQTCISMWGDVNDPGGVCGPNELKEQKGQLKYFDDLVDVLYRNMEEYAMNRKEYEASGKELPFIVHYLSPGWLAKVDPNKLGELLDYFCKVDREKPDGDRLLVPKAKLFGMISAAKGRQAFRDMLKNEMGWNGMSSKAVMYPFEGFIKYLESMEYSTLALPSRYGATAEEGEGKGDDEDDDGGGGQNDNDDDDDDDDEEEEDGSDD